MALAAACGSDDPAGVPDAGEVPDADEPADASVDASPDVDAGPSPDADAGGSAGDDLDLDVEHAGEAEGDWRVGAFRIETDELEDGEDDQNGDEDELFPVVKEEVASEPMTGETATIVIPEPDESQFGFFFETHAASYLLAVYDDRDGAGERSEDDPVEAVATEVVVYLEDDFDTGDETVPERTWLSVELDSEDDEIPVQLDPPVQLHELLHDGEVTVGGTAPGDLVGGDTRLSSAAFAGEGLEVLDNPPFDEPLSDEDWEITVSGSLADNRRVELGLPLPLPLNIEHPVAYEDEGDGLSSVELMEAHACHDGHPVGLVFIPEVLGPTAALTSHLAGIPRGWAPVALGGDEGLAPLSPDERAELTLEPTFECGDE